MSNDKNQTPAAPTPTVDAKALVSELVPTLLALENLRSEQAIKRQQLTVAAPPNRRICSACGQDADNGCMGKHTKMVVFPQRYPEHGEFFQGVFLNGVRYLSNDDQHEVTVPENAANGILQLVQAFENNEQTTRIGRRAENHASLVGGNSHSQRSLGWR